MLTPDDNLRFFSIADNRSENQEQSEAKSIALASDRLQLWLFTDSIQRGNCASVHTARTKLSIFSKSVNVCTRLNHTKLSEGEKSYMYDATDDSMHERLSDNPSALKDSATLPHLLAL